FQAEDGIRDFHVTGVQTCALPISRIGELRAGMTDGSDASVSLARISGELRIAETELSTRAQLVQQALQQMETARVEANRQVRYQIGRASCRERGGSTGVDADVQRE